MFGLFKKKTRANKNDAVRKALAGYGDDGTRPRHVIHFAYAKKGGQDAAAAEEIIRRYLAPDVLEPAEVGDGIRFEQNREVASAEFDAMTDGLERDLAEIGWEYDGWECAVETGEEE
ncbi:hypothetical protein GQ651_07430 [Alphaproteobacteria bacterium GH1-50]|uniref:Regulator of ribonuclease activity B domain-containing protein n=1 Tax=Kangsaoukella pontilimi TaxID=2691042 RepID=A0A7C9MWJ4_9RHOB|nr:ribonuclease E inhibitor RraB [Kangsaoukella pontilimi]MXQ07674.1 hypothetical protein [Kangsaoukella pontilimi]